MTGVEQDQPPGKSMTCPVREGKGSSFQRESIEDRVVGDATDGKERDEIGQRRDAREKKRAAGRDFLGRRLVLRRHAAHRVGDHAIDELKRLWRALLVMPARQTRLEQSGIEQLDRKSTRLNSSHLGISYAVFC